LSEELTSRQVAELLGISERSVLYAVERGELPATSFRKGKKRYWRFLPNDVETYRHSIEDEPGSQLEG
jgi:excisionase family DNA binding protein